MEPLPSNAGGYQTPPPEFTLGLPQRLVGTVLKCQRLLPVFASRAQSTPTPPPSYDSTALTGTVEMKILPSLKPGAMFMPSCLLRVRGTVQSSAPVFWLSANASVAVPP